MIGHPSRFVYAKRYSVTSTGIIYLNILHVDIYEVYDSVFAHQIRTVAVFSSLKAPSVEGLDDGGS